MKPAKHSIGLLLVSILCCAITTANAQQTTGHIKIRRCLFKGRWQLVQTFSLGSLHQVKKDEYDGIICFGPRHRYFEEVHYESAHWIIEGKWHINRKKGTLQLTRRNYTLGKLEDHPADIIFDIDHADKKSWTGSVTDKGQAAKVYYSRISKR